MRNNLQNLPKSDPSCNMWDLGMWHVRALIRTSKCRHLVLRSERKLFSMKASCVIVRAKSGCLMDGVCNRIMWHAVCLEVKQEDIVWKVSQPLETFCSTEHRAPYWAQHQKKLPKRKGTWQRKVMRRKQATLLEM